MMPLASLLANSPDPDGALNLLDRYVQAAPPEILGELSGHPSALTYVVAIFGYSAYLAESFLAEPALPIQFARDRRFAKLKSKEDLMQDYARFAERTRADLGILLLRETASLHGFFLTDLPCSDAMMARPMISRSDRALGTSSGWCPLRAGGVPNRRSWSASSASGRSLIWSGVPGR